MKNPLPAEPRRRRRLSVVWLVVLTVIPASPRAWGATQVEALRREENAKRIAALSAVERDRLKQNLKLFRELPPAERENLRNLQESIEADGRSGGNLQLVLNNYYDWLKTLTPGQRADLQRETDPVKRRRQVAELLQKQQEAADPSNPRRRRMGLSAVDLEQVLKILETQLLNEGYLTENSLAGKTGLARYSAVLRGAFTTEKREPFPPAWLKPELVEELVSAISDEEQRRTLARDKELRRRAGRLFMAVFSGIMLEFREQAESIDRGKLEAFFVGLKGEQQDEIMRLPPDAQNMKLKRLYMESHPEEFPQPPVPPPWLNQVLRGGPRGPGGPGGPERGGPGAPFGPGPGFGPGGEGNLPPEMEGDERNPRRPGPGGGRVRPRDRNRKGEG